MPDGWVAARLGDVATFLNHQRVPLSKRERSARQGKFPYHGAAGVLDHVDGFLFDGLYVLVGEDGSVEDSGGHPVLQLVTGRFWVSNHAHVLRMPTDIDTRWLFYALSRVAIAPFRSGSVQPKLSMGNLKMVPLMVPPPEERRAQVDLLSTLDDRIASNKRVCRTLLETAKAFYVDACSGEHRNLTLGDAASFHNRRRVPLSSRERDARVGPYPYYGATGVFGFVDDYLFDQILVLVGEDGTVVNSDDTPVTQYIWGRSWINNHAHPLTGVGISTELLHTALQAVDVRPIVTGAVQLKISMGNLKTLQLKIPTGRNLTNLEARLAHLYALYRQRTDESQSIVRLRDTLLPELIEGRVRTAAASEYLPEAIT